MDGFAGGRTLAGLVFAEEEGEADHEDGHPAEEAEDVLVGEGSGLLLELVVDASSCHVGGGGSLGGSAEGRGEGVELADVAGVAGLHGLLKAGLVEEGAIGDEGSGDGDKDGAADVADEVDDAGDLVGGFAGEADVGGVGDGDEGEGDGEHEDNAEPGVHAEGEAEIDVGGDVVEGDGEAGKADGGEVARGEFAGGDTGEGHDDDEGEAAAGEGFSGEGGGVAEKLLHELRLEDGGGVEDAADEDHEQAADGEVFVFEESDVHDGGFVTPLPPDEAGHAGDEEEGEDTDEAGGEPGVFFAFVEHDLHASHGEGEEAEADVVEAAEVGAIGLDPGRVVDEAGDEDEGEEADGDVDVEDPAPGVVVGDPAAEGGADGGGEDGDEAVEGKGLTALFLFEGVGHDGLGHGLEAAAPDALDDAGDEEDGQRGGDAAQKAGDGKEGDAGEEEVFAADDGGGPGTGGEDDGVGDEVGGEDPGALVSAGAEVAGDVREGDVGDGGVEDLHEGGEGDGGGDEPRVDPGLPLRTAGCC